MISTKLCTQCRRPRKIAKGATCDPCRLARQRAIEAAPARVAKKATRYNTDYRRARDMWATIVAADGFTCARGHETHSPGAPFHLDHLDHLDDGAIAPSCPFHNTSARSNPTPQEAH
jgi:hypothetical protein